jgi:threonine/homoserine/homoserine lactone efflux protein
VSPALSLVLTALVVMGSPGPATVGVTAVGAAFGVRRSLPYLYGVVAGTVAVLLAVAAGLGSVLAARPGLTRVLLVLAVAYLLYLAYRIATAPPMTAVAGRSTAPGWPTGLALAVSNPKAYAAIAAVLAGSDLRLSSAAVETLVEVAVLAALIVLIHVGWLVAGVFLTSALRRPRVSRAVNLALAVALLVSTVPAARQLLAG